MSVVVGCRRGRARLVAQYAVCPRSSSPRFRKSTIVVLPFIRVKPLVPSFSRAPLRRYRVIKSRKFTGFTQC